MKPTKKGILLLLFAVLCCGTMFAGEITYTYTGNNFIEVWESTYNLAPWGVTTSDRITASWTFDSPLAPGLCWTNISPASWVISDGLHTLSSSLAGVHSDYHVVSTDSSGHISAWSFSAYWYEPTGSAVVLNTYFNGISLRDYSEHWDSYSNRVALADLRSEYTGQGSWTEGVSSVPEPSLALLLASGLFGLAGIRRKFGKHEI